MSDTVIESPSFLAIKQVLKQLVAPQDNQLCALLGLFKAKRLNPGDYFVRAGEPSTELAFVNSGILRFFYQTASGKEFNKSFSTANQFAAAYSAFLTGAPARFSIQALEETHLLVGELNAVIALFDKDRCWEKLGRLLAEQLYIKKETREAEFMLDDAKTRYLRFQESYPGLETRIAQYHVASYIGITPVMLSRIRKQ